MKPILIVYATREGHTRHIAEHVREALNARGFAAEAFDARATDAPDLSRYSAAILAASLHMGQHEKEMARFIERERAKLEQLPSAFLSVSLSATGAQDERRPADYRASVTRELEKISNELFEKTGWHPARHAFVAGALMYTKYNVLVRWVMKRIAHKEGASTDTTRDHVYTDWNALDRFVDEFLHTLQPVAATGS